MRRYLLLIAIIASVLIPIEHEAIEFHEYLVNHELVELSQEIYLDWRYVEIEN